LHHWGGRADDSKSKEMCIECHVHCGHNGHTRNFAINPRYCRLAAQKGSGLEENLDPLLPAMMIVMTASTARR
jgi:hypothetical protein